MDEKEEQVLGGHELEALAADAIFGPELLAVYFNHLTNGRLI